MANTVTTNIGDERVFEINIPKNTLPHHKPYYIKHYNITYKYWFAKSGRLQCMNLHHLISKIEMTFNSVCKVCMYNKKK